jgi:hypothetical protein
MCVVRVEILVIYYIRCKYNAITLNESTTRVCNYVYWLRLFTHVFDMDSNSLAG